jgi:L-ascorbate metabolism protein UlaG (beta-lactamase superfamily)
MKKFIGLSIILLAIACKKETKENTGQSKVVEKEIDVSSEMPFEITPIQHATFVMEWGDEVVYLDPTGGKGSFENIPDPNLVLITDIHGDHFNVETLQALPMTFDIIAPMAVYEKMPKDMQAKTKTLNNGKTLNFHGFEIKAIPMYNMTKERKKFHEKGRGNGYVLAKDNYKLYVSGDTEDIPEMRNLNNIDLAFICMNLPYTMTPEAAADAILEFQPKKVIPYHYRGAKDGETHYFDIKNFKNIVNSGNGDIEVELLDWYPSR